MIEIEKAENEMPEFKELGCFETFAHKGEPHIKLLGSNSAYNIELDESCEISDSIRVSRINITMKWRY